MKLLASLLGITRKNEARNESLAESKHEMLVRMGRQQFKKLDELGLSIPVALS